MSNQCQTAYPTGDSRKQAGNAEEDTHPQEPTLPNVLLLGQG